MMRGREHRFEVLYPGTLHVVYLTKVAEKHQLMSAYPKVGWLTKCTARYG